MIARPAQDPGTEEHGEAGQEKSRAENRVEQGGRVRAGSDARHDQERDRGRWNASAREPGDDLPVDRRALVVDDRTNAFGHGRVKQVGANGSRGVEAEEQHQERSHERAAADSGHADQRADEETGEGIERIVCREDRRPLAQTIDAHGIIALCAVAERCFAEPCWLGKWPLGNGRDLPRLLFALGPT
jgi:hypothetical protein